MISEIKLKNYMGIILQAGIFLSITLVLIGGCWFLYLHGNDQLSAHSVGWVERSETQQSLKWHTTPTNIINLGLYILVAAQIVRVALLCLYYTLIFDEWFMFFSYFILFVILYSF